MLRNIILIEEARSLFGDSAAEAALNKLFRRNNGEIKEASAVIAEAKELLTEAETASVRNSLKALLEVTVQRKKELKEKRIEAKEYLRFKHDTIWEECPPIDISDIIKEMFQS